MMANRSGEPVDGPENVFLFQLLVKGVAEQEGFEPSIRGYRIHTFQACAFDHSATAPHVHSRVTAKLLEPGGTAPQ